MDLIALKGLLVPEKVSADDLPVRLERADEDKGRRLLLREMADAGNRITDNALAFYHRTVREMTVVAANSRRLKRQYRMAPKDIVAELAKLGVIGFGVDLKFRHQGVDYEVEHYALTTSNLAKIEAAFTPLIKPMEITSNGKVVYAPTISPKLSDALSTALLGAKADLTLDKGQLVERIEGAVTSKVLPQGKVASVLKSVNRAAMIASDRKKLVFKDGRYEIADATQKEVDAADDKLQEQVGELMDILVLSDDQMTAKAAADKVSRAAKAKRAKDLRELGGFAEKIIPLLQEFDIEDEEQLRAMLTAARNAGYTPEVAAELHTESAASN